MVEEQKLPMETIKRKFDVQELCGPRFTVDIDGRSVIAAEGETVISILNAIGIRGFSQNDHRLPAAGYCWMGVCQSCLVKIDGRYKRRACQTIARPGMRIETNVNRISDMGLT